MRWVVLSPSWAEGWPPTHKFTPMAVIRGIKAEVRNLPKAVILFHPTGKDRSRRNTGLNNRSFFREACLVQSIKVMKNIFGGLKIALSG